MTDAQAVQTDRIKLKASQIEAGFSVPGVGYVAMTRPEKVTGADCKPVKTGNIEFYGHGRNQLLGVFAPDDEFDFGAVPEQRETDTALMSDGDRYNVEMADGLNNYFSVSGIVKGDIAGQKHESHRRRVAQIAHLQADEAEYQVWLTETYNVSVEMNRAVKNEADERNRQAAEARGKTTENNV